MAEDFGTPITDFEEPEKKKNTTLIIVIVVLVVLCCCCAAVGFGGYYLYQNGDEIFGLTNLAHALIL